MEAYNIICCQECDQTVIRVSTSSVHSPRRIWNLTWSKRKKSVKLTSCQKRYKLKGFYKYILKNSSIYTQTPVKPEFSYAPLKSAVSYKNVLKLVSCGQKKFFPNILNVQSYKCMNSVLWSVYIKLQLSKGINMCKEIFAALHCKYLK